MKTSRTSSRILVGAGLGLLIVPMIVAVLGILVAVVWGCITGSVPWFVVVIVSIPMCLVSGSLCLLVATVLTWWENLREEATE